MNFAQAVQLGSLAYFYFLVRKVATLRGYKFVVLDVCMWHIASNSLLELPVRNAPPQTTSWLTLKLTHATIPVNTLPQAMSMSAIFVVKPLTTASPVRS